MPSITPPPYKSICRRKKKSTMMIRGGRKKKHRTIYSNGIQFIVDGMNIQAPRCIEEREKLRIPAEGDSSSDCVSSQAGSGFDAQPSQNTRNFSSYPRKNAATRGSHGGALYFSVVFLHSKRFQPSLRPLSELSQIVKSALPRGDGDHDEACMPRARGGAAARPSRARVNGLSMPIYLERTVKLGRGS